MRLVKALLKSCILPCLPGTPLHFNDGTGISRQRYVSMSRESEEILLPFFLYSLNPNHPPLKRYNSKYFIVILE